MKKFRIKEKTIFDSSDGDLSRRYYPQEIFKIWGLFPTWIPITKWLSGGDWTDVVFFTMKDCQKFLDNYSEFSNNVKPKYHSYEPQKTS